MDLNFADETYMIDLSYAASASDIVFELSSIMTNDMAKNQKIALKLGSVDLNQSQLLSIRSLISSINSTVAYLETGSEQTEQAAINLGIVVANPTAEEKKEESLPTVELAEPTYVQSYGYVKLEDHIEEEDEKEESDTTEEAIDATLEPTDTTELEEAVAEPEATESTATEAENDAEIVIPKEEINNDAVISESEADEILEAKAEEVQDALSDIYTSEVKLESILVGDATPVEEGVISAELVKQAILNEQTYTEADFEIDHFATTYIKQTLRSGQTVNYDGNVVIIGDCHPGSEVIASGDITVWGILSGIAHAGAKGNMRARVRALKMNAIQLRIGKCFARKPDGMNTIFPERTSTFTPEEARVVNNEIVIFKIND